MTAYKGLLDRAAREEREVHELAPWAMKSQDSLGRVVKEDPSAFRTCFERDRDRLTHCTGFRRLMYKTQVFVNRRGDHQRTRLSHSLEVCQVARSVGGSLRLNEALCEVVALAHDIGHPPFGHRGESALQELMSEHGGFRHNNQVLRVVDLLERRNPDYHGLNLTREVRESLLKHEADEVWPDEFLPRRRHPLLEAQVADLADSTAYHKHDLIDGLTADMFSEETLHAECALWREACERVEERHPGFLMINEDQNLRIERVANELIGACIQDLIEASATAIEDAAITNAAAARDHERLLITHSKEMRVKVAELHAFLYRRFYQHPELAEFSVYAREILGKLFDAYTERPQEMRPWYQAWAAEVGTVRAACDYIAGMTDRFAESEHARLTQSLS